MKINWYKAFAEAGRSLIIQNVNPAPSQGSRNIFSEDYEEIMVAARKYGYSTRNEKDKIVNFVKSSGG